MKIGLDFLRINLNWNIDHEEPGLSWSLDGVDLLLTVSPEYRRGGRFAPGDRATLRFRRVSLYRLGPPGEEGWRRGECRYGHKAIEWGHVYEVIGRDERRLWPKDWLPGPGKPAFHRHFMIQLRDATFECIAEACLVDPSRANALYTKGLEASKMQPLGDRPGWRERLMMRVRRAAGVPAATGLPE